MKLAHEWFGALRSLPSIAPRLLFRKRTLEEELQEAMLRGSLRKTFGGFDVLCLGLGILIGSGWAQFTGTAGVYAGVAVVVSVLMSGLCALCAGACYAELCVEFPVSGGAFSYVMITFGELAACAAVASLILEYVSGMALVARGFSTYLARLCNLPADYFRVGPQTVGGGQFDLMALAIVLVISAILTLGMRESTFITTYTTVIKVVVLLFVCIVGYTAGSASHLSPFLNPAWEEDGVFLGSSVLFFSYVGFDALGTAAEEVKNVNHIPWAIVGSITGSGLLYFMLALALVLMTAPNVACPYATYFSSLNRLNFVTVFNAVGLNYMQYIVSVGALLGSTAALIVGLFSVSRVVMAASRDWLLPPFLARISPRTQTPVIAQLVLGFVISIIGMVVNNNAMVPLVSFGTLSALWLVVNAMLYRRYTPGVHVRITRHGTIEADKSERGRWSMPLRRRLKLSVRARHIILLVHMAALNGVCVALAAYYQASATPLPDEYVPPKSPPGAQECPPMGEGLRHSLDSLFFLLAWALVAASFLFWCPLEYEPPGWRIPWWMMPWLPALALLLVVFNLAALPNSGYWKIGAYFGGATAFYLFFSLPMSYVKHSRVDHSSNDDLTPIEIAFIEGQWRPARQALASVGSVALRPSMSTLGSTLGSLPGAYPSGAYSGAYPSGVYPSGIYSAFSGQVARVSGSSTASSGMTAFGSGRVGAPAAEPPNGLAVEPSGSSFGSSPLAVSPRTAVGRPGGRRLPPASAPTLPPTQEEEEMPPTAS